MDYVEFAPSKHVAEFIRCFWTLEQDGDVSETTAEPILPDGCPEIVFNLAAPFRQHYQNTSAVQPRTIIVGQMKQFILIEPSGAVNLFGVRFQPFGLYPLIKQSLNELTNRVESIETVFDRFGLEIEEKINKAKSTSNRIDVFETFFYSLIEGKHAGAVSLQSACNMISETGGMLSIGNLTKSLGTNSKQLERRFNREIGLSPKSFSRITRLQTILQRLNNAAVANWADLACGFGYFDQAHFIKDFREFTGNSPEEYVKQQNRLTEFFIQ